MIKKKSNKTELTKLYVLREFYSGGIAVFTTKDNLRDFLLKAFKTERWEYGEEYNCYEVELNEPFDSWWDKEQIEFNPF